MLDQVIGIGSVSALVYLSVQLTRAFREGARFARSGALAELEQGIVRIPDLEGEPSSAG